MGFLAHGKSTRAAAPRSGNERAHSAQSQDYDIVGLRPIHRNSCVCVLVWNVQIFLRKKSDKNHTFWVLLAIYSNANYFIQFPGISTNAVIVMWSSTDNKNNNDNNHILWFEESNHILQLLTHNHIIIKSFIRIIPIGEPLCLHAGGWAGISNCGSGGE